MQMKLHHLLHEHFMKPQLRSFQLAEPGAGAGLWPRLPRAGGDRDACAAVCPGQRLVSSPLLDVTWPPPLRLSSPGSHGQRVSSIPGSVSWGSGGPRAGAGKGDAECRDGVWQPRKMVFPMPTGCSASPRCSSFSSPSGPACSLEHSFPTAASLADAITNLSPLPALP